MITVIGCDGSPLPEQARRALRTADLVVGSHRHLDGVPLAPHARRLTLGPLAPALDALTRAQARQADAVVLAGGDPGWFGIVRALAERGLRPQVLPAVSSVSLAFARAGLGWDDALVVSAHGRDVRPVLHACLAHPKVAVLTGPGSGPAEIGSWLQAALGPGFGTRRRDLVVAENLGHADERVTRCTPREAAAGTWPAPSVLLALDPDRPGAARGWAAPPPGGPDGWALPEGSFEHRDSMITKSEVRAAALARLGPRQGRLVWDVGAGSGAVAVECARFGAAVVAVERDAAQADRVLRNAERFGVAVRVVHGTAPEALRGLPDPDAVFVGGGGPRVVSVVCDVLARRPEVVVASLTAVERVGPVLEALRSTGNDVGGVSLQANRLTALPDGASRLAATNPVTLLWSVPPPAAGHEGAVGPSPKGAG